MEVSQGVQRPQPINMRVTIDAGEPPPLIMGERLRADDKYSLQCTPLYVITVLLAFTFHIPFVYTPGNVLKSSCSHAHWSTSILYSSKQAGLHYLTWRILLSACHCIMGNSSIFIPSNTSFIKIKLRLLNILYLYPGHQTLCINVSPSEVDTVSRLIAHKSIFSVYKQPWWGLARGSCLRSSVPVW